MKAQFENASIKIWFANQSTSRNINNVIEIEYVSNIMAVKTNDGKTTMINFDNVNLVEELNGK